MNRTITAMFDTREDAEAGRQRLVAANIHADNVRLHNEGGEAMQSGQSYGQTGGQSASQNRGTNSGLWGSIKNAMLPDDDRQTYEEGVRRGGVVLSADVDEDEVDEAVRALEQSNCVDIEDRSKSWRSEGWAGPQTGAASAVGADWDRNRTGDTSTGDRAMSGTEGNERLQVVEEKLVVGKREAERGGVRVRSYVTEQPVHEQVRLREEHVNVERRPVDQRLEGSAGDAFQERTVEMTERNEEAVVGKEARVVEEVLLSKTSGERTQDIDDTVRRTNVDVEQIGGTERTGSGFTPDRSTGLSGGSGESLGDKARNAFENVKDDVTGNRNQDR